MNIPEPPPNTDLNIVWIQLAPIPFLPKAELTMNTYVWFFTPRFGRRKRRRAS